nr:FAD binding domain-containing protein [Dehalococcoidales bacterium]
KARPDCFKLGGDVCHAIDKGRRCLAVYQGDLAPALVALGARVRIVGVSGEKAIPLTQFYTGNGEKPNVLEPGDILAEVQIPPSSGNTWGGYEKLRVREGMDFPLAGVAVSIKTNANGAIDQARLVLGAVAPSPLEVPEATELLVGQKLTDSLLESVAQKAYDRARPVANLAVDASYRRKMVRVLVKRAIGRAVSGNG